MVVRSKAKRVSQSSGRYKGANVSAPSNACCQGCLDSVGCTYVYRLSIRRTGTGILGDRSYCSTNWPGSRGKYLCRVHEQCCWRGMSFVEMSNVGGIELGKEGPQKCNLTMRWD
jgi:hypothetical protein